MLLVVLLFSLCLEYNGEVVATGEAGSDGDVRSKDTVLRSTRRRTVMKTLQLPDEARVLDEVDV
jgi:hypothetical protein